MVYRIIGYLMFAFLVVALVLSFAGVREVYLGNGIRNWLVSVSNTFDSWNFQIPKVPNIPYLESEGEIIRSVLPKRVVTVPVINVNNNVLDQLKNILNTVVFFVNFIITLFNVLVTVVNVVIGVIQYILTIVWCVKDLPSYLTNNEWARYNGELTVWWWKNIGQ